MVSESVEKILQTEASGEQKLEKAKSTADEIILSAKKEAEQKRHDILKKADKKIKEMSGCI